MTGPRGPGRRTDLTYRPVRTDELTACAEIWRVAINDYIGRLGQPEIPAETAPLRPPVSATSQATDPERFVVAVRTPTATGRGRSWRSSSAIVRERLWYLSMLFVSPEVQARASGAALLAQVMLPGDTDGDAGPWRWRPPTASSRSPTRCTPTYGIVPRMPLLEPDRAAATARGVRRAAVRGHARRLRAIAAGPPDGPGHRELVDAVDAPRP